MNSYFKAAIVVFALVILGGVFLFGKSLAPASPASLGAADGGIAYNEASVTNASTTCSASTSTLIVGKQPGRTSFTSVVAGATNVYLCKASTGCTAQTGIMLNANGGSFEQTDSYMAAIPASLLRPHQSSPQLIHSNHEKKITFCRTCRTYCPLHRFASKSDNQ